MMAIRIVRRRSFAVESIKTNSAQMITDLVGCGAILWYKLAMHWIYLSPHLDDAAFSCGGLIWEQIGRGDRVEIWTVCAGDPPKDGLSPFAAEIHERWQTGLNGPAHRREEDRLSCRILGAEPRHFSLGDCIYRRSPRDGSWLYTAEEHLFGDIHPEEEQLVATLADELDGEMPAQASLVAPLTIGGHVDHRLVRRAAERIDRPLAYYVEFPYAIWFGEIPEALIQGLRAGNQTVSERGLEAWVASAVAHASQISSFWLSQEDMEADLGRFAQRQGGVQLWQPMVQAH